VNRLRRFLKITWVVSKYRLDEFIPLATLPLLLRLLLWLAPWHLFPRPDLPRGERLRRALEELGPIFVKFGQILSTRRDLLPDDIANELKYLQDKVPPFDSNLARQRIEQSLRRKVEDAFARFDETPLASASIAQVHSAQLHNGKEVVIKIIRPGIAPIIRQDIALMFMIARLVERYWEDGKRLHPVDIVADYEQTIFDELDLQREAANTSQLRRNFQDSPLIYIPEVYWEYTNTKVLVMERIYGTPIADVETLKAKGTDMKKLAERGVEIFFTQVFRDSFFHADMHPGNIFVSTENPQEPQYIAIDCGIVGTLSPEDQNYLARNLLAFFKRDYHQVALLHVESGWVPPTTRVDEFESAIRTVCEPIFERPLSEISFGHFLLRLFQTARRFDMEVQPQLVLLQKTLLNVEGLGRQLYPELDLWSTAHPFLERWLRDRIGPPRLMKAVRQHLPEWLEHTPEVPQLIFEAMSQIRHLDRFSQGQDRALEALRLELRQERQQDRRQWLALAFIATAALSATETGWAWLGSIPPHSWLLAGAGLYLLLRPQRRGPR